MTSFYGGNGGGSIGDVDVSNFMQKNNPTFKGTLTGDNAEFNGEIKIQEPINEENPTTKKYVDNEISKINVNFPTTDLTELQNSIEDIKNEQQVQNESLDFINSSINGLLPKDNPTYTGLLSGENLNISNEILIPLTPISDNNATSKQYVDNKIKEEKEARENADNNNSEQIASLQEQIENFLSKTGDTATGIYDFTESVINVSLPTSDNNVTNKKYVDTKIATIQGSGVSYTQGNGITISPENTISINLNQNKANGLKIDSDGLSLENASSVQSGAMSAIDKQNLDTAIQDINNIKTGSTDFPYIKDKNGSFSGTLTGENTIFTGSVQIREPIEDNEATNKSYVDDQIKNVKLSYYTPNVDEYGNLTWTGNNEGMLPIDSSNIMGPQGPKGDTGEQGIQGPAGNDGAAGGFGTPTASIDNSVGIPQVLISSSGPNTAKVFDFRFSGLKGEQGQIGPQGEKGDPGEQGAQGPKGDTGPQGESGIDGKTPIKGTDYWTDSDKEEIKNELKEEVVLSVNNKKGEVELVAQSLPFDNAGTPFVSTTVQDAIEELLSIGGGGGGAVASTINVTAPAGATVTISQGSKSYTQTVGISGTPLTFRVLETGYWNVLAVMEGTQDSGSVNVTEAGGTYSIVLDFAPYKAYIKVTGPDGATVNVTKSGKSVSGIISGGSVTLTVNEDGQWSVAATYKDGIAQATTVTVSEEGETYTAEAKFCTLTVTAPAGSTVEIKNGVATLTDTASSGSVKFWLPNTGTWTVKATLNDQTATGSVDCSAYQDYSTELAYFSATILVSFMIGGEIFQSTLTATASLGDYAVTKQLVYDGTAYYAVELPVSKQGLYNVFLTYTGVFSGNINCTSKVGSVNIDSTESVLPAVFIPDSFYAVGVITSEGSTVKASKGDIEITQQPDVAMEPGTYLFFLPSVGKWTVTATLGSDSVSQTVNITDYGVQDVTLSFIPETLNDATWAQLHELSASGKLGDYYAEGDSKSVTLNGTVGNVRFSNLSVNAFLIGINHNSSREGDNKSHFQLGKIGNKHVAFCDSQYDQEGSSSDFCINSSTYEVTWSSCGMRNEILGNDHTPQRPGSGNFIAALPSDLRAVMQSCQKYSYEPSSSTWGGSVKSTTDYLTLPSEFEVMGSTQNASSSEKNYQAQYQYYKSGNSKTCYKHSATSQSVSYWTRSPSGSSPETFWCSIYNSSTVDKVMQSLGISPIFFV